MKKIGLCVALTGLQLLAAAQQRPVTRESFSSINLDYPGLEQVRTHVEKEQYPEAAASLLAYYRKKNAAKAPDFSNGENAVDVNKPVDKAARAFADSGMLHKFQPHKGYGFFDYGKDINWQLWPVKDNEVRWQLHRVKWWQPMALMYRATQNEQYADEWMAQFTHWVAKNPLGLSADNDKYAWRPLEVSDRIQSLVPTFEIFVRSPGFTPSFLMEFLASYGQQADYLPAHYAEIGNHRLFEAQRVLFAGASFPEFRNAPAWRKSGIEVLNAEIKKQVYPDGVQFELSPAYHAAAVDIFLKAYSAAQSAGLEKEFPASYKQTVESMVMALANFTFPDYQTPMFGDSWLVDRRARLRQFTTWAGVFPQNSHLRYFASEGAAGSAPGWLSKGLTTAGFYTFRNGWDKHATVMVLKASPPGEFHAQPDNGTFELWVKGRNFMPDAGVYVYSGDTEIQKLREAYRRTRVHNTLTLNNENMVITKARLAKWQTGKALDMLTYSNPSYSGLDHQRSVLFVDRSFFVIIDKATGGAAGNLGVHYVLKEDSKPVIDSLHNKVYTTYADGNNLLVQYAGSGKVTMKEEEGSVSYKYREAQKRPAFVFERPKREQVSETFVTIIYPYSGTRVPDIRLKENPGNNYDAGTIDVTLTVNGTEKKVRAALF